MKKSIVIIVIIILLFIINLKNCFLPGGNNETEEGTIQSTEKVSEPEKDLGSSEDLAYAEPTQESTAVSVVNSGNDPIETVYRLKTEKMKIDMSGFLDLLTQYEKLGQIEINFEKQMVDGEETGVAAFTKDGAVHTCIETHYGLLYQNNCDAKTEQTVNYDRIRRYIDEFVAMIENAWGWKFDLESVEEEENEIGLTRLYRWSYAGVKMMGKHALYLSKEDEVPLYGSYIKITAGPKGIGLIDLYAPPKIKEIQEAYVFPDDLLSEEQQREFLFSYIADYYELFSIKAEAEPTIISCFIIYMPNKDSKGEAELIPAFEITTKSKENGQERTRVYFMDAKTGYIYDSFLLSK